MPTTTPTDMRDRIAEAALRMIEEGGVAALSMRTLAAEVGVAPNTIYWHLGSREEVVRAAIDRLAGTLTRGRVRGADSHERVFSILRNVRAMSVDHRNIAAAALELGMTARLQMPWQRALARELHAAGLRGPRLADVMRGLLYTTGGFVVIASHQRTGRLGSEHEWSLVDDADDTGIDHDAMHALTTPVDLDAHFRDTLMALIRAVVPLG